MGSVHVGHGWSSTVQPFCVRVRISVFTQSMDSSLCVTAMDDSFRSVRSNRLLGAWSTSTTGTCSSLEMVPFTFSSVCGTSRHLILTEFATCSVSSLCTTGSSESSLSRTTSSTIGSMTSMVLRSGSVSVPPVIIGSDSTVGSCSAFSSQSGVGTAAQWTWFSSSSGTGAVTTTSSGRVVKSRPQPTLVFQHCVSTARVANVL